VSRCRRTPAARLRKNARPASGPSPSAEWKMKLNEFDYEGAIYGVPDQSFRKVANLLKNAFEEADFEFIGEDAGTVKLSGAKQMLHNEEDRTALFDLICDILTMDAGGRMLKKKFGPKGDLELVLIVFSKQGWEEMALEMPA
jgi:hypothetical protein